MLSALRHLSHQPMIRSQPWLVLWQLAPKHALRAAITCSQTPVLSALQTTNLWSTNHQTRIQPKVIKKLNLSKASIPHLFKISVFEGPRKNFFVQLHPSKKIYLKTESKKAESASNRFSGWSTPELLVADKYLMFNFICRRKCNGRLLWAEKSWQHLFHVSWNSVFGCHSTPGQVFPLWKVKVCEEFGWI